MRVAISTVWILSTCLVARGGVILDKPPNQLGGGASDTSFYNEFGEERWQRLADDVLLTQTATIRRVIWHGFYGDSSKNTPEPLPLTETMRIRLYDARPGDGLPGNVLFEESFLDPSRVATGQVVFTGPDPLEQRYQVDLSNPFDLQASTSYWLEIAQLGDPDSAFRWESSPQTGTRLAFINANVGDWSSLANSNTSFQLSSVPEPSSTLLWGLVLWIGGRR